MSLKSVPSPSCLPENTSVKTVLYWLINAQTPHETDVRISYLIAKYPRMKDYLSNLRRLQTFWASWSSVGEMVFGVKSSSLVEQLNHSVKSQMRKKLLVELLDLVPFLLRVTTCRKRKKADKLTYTYLSPENWTNLANMLPVTYINQMKLYLSVEGIL